MGMLVTGWSDDAYLEPLDGGMVEGFMWPFGQPLNERDWHLQVERILRLIGNDEILVAQTYGYGLDDQRARRWIFTNYLLLKGRHGFAAFYPNGTGLVEAPVWLPEYDLVLGAPEAELPPTPHGLCTLDADDFTCGGVYARRFAQGVAVVNPSPDRRTFDPGPAPAGTRWTQARYTGGGYVGADGRPAAQSLDFDAVEVPVTLEPSTATVLVARP
jgi:hypothetical protein